MINRGLPYYFLLLSSIAMIPLSCEAKKVEESSHNIDVSGPIESFATSVNDAEIHYTEYGDGPTLVVLVHGWNCDQSYWSEQIVYLEKKYHVVALDLAGHGQSTSGSREDWTMEAFAADVTNVLNNLTYDQLILVGHSMGTAIVLKAAENMDQDNLSVVCVDQLKQPMVPLTDEILDPQMAPLKEDFKAATSAFIRSSMFNESADSTVREAIVEDMTSAPAKESIAMIYSLMKTDLNTPIAALNERNIATYIINASNTPTDIPHYQEKGFKVDIIEDTGHFLMMEKPAEFNALLGAFIESDNS